MPDVSVVIVTHNRPGLLADLLRALASQSSLPEIVVVDNGDGGPAPCALCDQYDYRPGDGYHRVDGFNWGVAHASGSFVILLDDDQLPVSRHFVAAHAEVLRRYAHVCRGQGIDALGQASSVPWFSTANLGLVRELALQLGPFDRAYDGHYGYEDHDLGQQLSRLPHIAIAPGGPDTATRHLGGPHQGDVSADLALNRAYYCHKWSLPNA